MQGTQLTSHVPAPACSTASEQDRHRDYFTSPMDDGVYPSSSSRPRLELPHCPSDFGLEFIRLPTRNSWGEWSFAEDLSLPASNVVSPIDFSAIGFSRAFMENLRTDRQLVESSASFENNHSAITDLDSSSGTSTSAYGPCQLHVLKGSMASQSSAFRFSDNPVLVVLDRVY